MGVVARRLTAGLAALVLACSAQASTPVVVRTDQGDLALELDPARAPRSVARFLAAPYAGSLVCEVRAHGYLVLGCVPSPTGAPGWPSFPPSRRPTRSMGPRWGLAIGF